MEPFPVYDPEEKLGPEPSRETGPPTRPSADWTLSQFYAAHFRLSKELGGLERAQDPRTHEAYETALKYWARFTGNPPIAEITERSFAVFLNRLKTVKNRAGAPISGSTRRKHWCAIQCLLKLTGPKSDRNRKGAGLVAEAVFADPPQQTAVPKPVHKLSTIHALLEACWSAPLSSKMIEQDVAPAVWWRSLILFLYNTGQRIGTALSLGWEQLDEDHWVAIRQEQLKGKRKGLNIYLNGPAQEAIQVLWRPTGRIFAWRSWPASKNTLHAHLRELERRAGLGGYGFHGLRRAFASQCVALNPMVAAWMMNHRAPGMRMMLDHYMGDRPEAVPPVLERLPQPGKAIQRALFDKQDGA